MNDVVPPYLCTSIPNNVNTKVLLKRAVTRANLIDYRYSCKGKKRKRKRKPKENRGDSVSSVNGSVFLGGILEESIVDKNVATSVRAQTEDSDNESLSDDGSNCDIEASAFLPDVDLDEDGRSPTDDLVDNEKEMNFMSDEWKWDNWEEIGDDDKITGMPPFDDVYNGPHGLRPGIVGRFKTVLQCVMHTTAMSVEFFDRLTAQSNKYARKDMLSRNSTLFIGHKWDNIRVSEMIRFFGIMLRISLEPRKMGGYTTYFTDNSSMSIGHGYNVELQGYHAWAKEIMPLIRFKQIRSAFHPEAGDSQCNDKCHQLRYFIRMFNYMAKDVFYLGENVSFDEGGVAMRSRYCPVRQYNKDKPEKFRVDFFIMADAEHHFIYHLDVYQGKNKANIDINQTLHKLPTTQKAVANAILKSRIANDVNGCRRIFMDNRYCAPQLLALMLTNYNIRGVGTCKANRIGFDSDKLQIPKTCDRGTLSRRVDKRIGMVITRWKDSRVLQTVSTIMKKGIGEVSRRRGASKLTVRCPNDIIEYQKHMDGVDRGDQHRVVGAGFANVAHFKKWYKKAFLGICDFSFLQAFTAWNLGVDYKGSRRGGSCNLRKLKKWEFYAIAAEEMMTYLDGEEVKIIEMQSYTASHIPMPIPTDKENKMKAPTCMICSMEEGVKYATLDTRHKNQRSYSRRTSHLSVCADPNCNIICHSCCPDESRVNQLPQFKGMSCFEIAHHEQCRNLFVEVERKGQKYTRSIRKHNIIKLVANLYRKDIDNMETEVVPKKKRRGRPRLEVDSAHGNTMNVASPPISTIQPTSINDNISLLGGSPTSSVSTRISRLRVRTRSRQKAVLQMNTRRKQANSRLQLNRRRTTRKRK